MLYCGKCGDEDVHVEHPLFLGCPGRLRAKRKVELSDSVFP